jgi:hypothetical protein
MWTRAHNTRSAFKFHSHFLAFSRDIEVSERPKRPQLPPSDSTVSGGYLVHRLLCGKLSGRELLNARPSLFKFNSVLLRALVPNTSSSLLKLHHISSSCSALCLPHSAHLETSKTFHCCRGCAELQLHYIAKSWSNLIRILGYYSASQFERAQCVVFIIISRVATGDFCCADCLAQWTRARCDALLVIIPVLTHTDRPRF